MNIFESPFKYFTLLIILSTIISMSRTQKFIKIHYKIPEELPNGSFVGNIVNDANLSALYNSSEFMQLRFGFESTIYPPNSFVLDPITGVLETGKGRIDREELCLKKEICSLLLDIEITPHKLRKLIQVNVTILDVNDNEPTFPYDRYVLKVSENSRVGDAFSLKGAVDSDSPQFSIVDYDMKFWTNSQRPFELRWEKLQRPGMQQDPSLVLVEALDREKQDAYFANITATDGGNPPKSKTMILEVRIIDVNDNDPVFDQPTYTAIANEDLPVGSRIIRVHASDADEGLNGHVVYGFSEHSDTFRIDNMTGEIFIVASLDYETKSSHELIVQARDLGIDSKVKSANVWIEVKDVNDNKPEIVIFKTSNTVSVIENSPPGTFVAGFRVKDPDSGAGGLFDCYIEEVGRNNRNRDKTVFKLTKISPNRYDIETSSELDREKKESYILKIFCDDRGEPSLRSEILLNVAVEDVNDCTPTFERIKYSVDLTENNYEGSIVTTLNAYDCDVGDNAKISYKLISGKEYFAIDQNTGMITSLVSIDREQIGDVIDFTVIAVDGGHPPRTSTASVTVSINDVNDNRPIFDFPSYYFNVSENLSSPALVGRVRASDNDKVFSDNSKIVYSILPGISSAFFQITEDTGVISTTRILDRESESVHYFIVSAQDSGSPTLSSTVSIAVVVDDRNDNPPLFEFPPSDNTTIQLSTRASAGYEVTRFKATDMDSGANGDVIYGMDNETLAEMGFGSLFELDHNTGLMTLCSNDIRRFNGKTVYLKIWTEDKARYPDVKLKTESIIRIVFNISAPIVINGELVDGDNWMLVLGLYGDSLTTVALIIAATIAGLLTVFAVLIIFCLKKRKRIFYRKEKNINNDKQQQYNCRTGSLKMFTPMPPSSTMDCTSDGEYGRCDIETPLNQGVKTFETNESRSLLNNYANPRTIDIRPIQTECRSNIYTTQPVNFGNYWPTVSQYGKMNQTSSQCPIIPESPLPPYQQLDRSFEPRDLNSRLTPADQRSISQPPTYSRTMSRADKEAKHLLEILKEDSVLESISLSSDQGANSDSGKGASEEGGDGRVGHNAEDCVYQSQNRLTSTGSVIAVPCSSMVCQQTPKVHCSPLTSTQFGRSSPMFPQPSIRCPIQNFGSRCLIKSPVYENKPKRNSYGEIRYSVNQEHIKYQPLSPSQVQTSVEKNVQIVDPALNNMIHINVYQESHRPSLSSQNQPIPSSRVDRTNFLTARNCHSRNIGYKPLNRDPDGSINPASQSCFTDEDDAISSTSGSYVVESREK